MNLPLIWGSRPGWLLSHSLQAGVLVLLVLLVQWLFRRQLTNRWRFALWWIVLARLLLPFGPESAVSLFNVFRPAVQWTTPPSPVPSVVTPAINPATPNPSSTIPHPALWPDDAPLAGQDPMAEDATVAPVGAMAADPTVLISPPVRKLADWLIPGLTGLWLAGVLGLFGLVAVQFLRFQQKLTAGSRPAEASLRKLLEECRREFGMTRTVELLETDAVQSPALFGPWRLRLLLPPGLAGQFNRSELRYIFLHELAHVQRGDLWLNWLVTGLQVVHWFNPLLWLGFARLRADRELACDELALLRAGDQAGTAYGETVVKLLENLNRPAVIPGLVGILEDKQQMRRRIVMIANFRRPGRWSLLAGLLVAALAMAALTDAETEQTNARIKVEGDSVTATNLPRGETKQYDPTYNHENTMVMPDGAVSYHADTNHGKFTDAFGKTVRVLTPDGQPAAGATLMLLENQANQAALNSDGSLTAYGSQPFTGLADAEGYFRLPSVAGMTAVAATNPQGFAVVSVESLATNDTIKLEPFGQISGTLEHASNGPGTNEILGLSFADPESGGEPPINLTHVTTTDSTGHFYFKQVPAGHLKIWMRTTKPGETGPPLGDKTLQEVDLKAGQDLPVVLILPGQPGEDSQPNPNSVPAPKRIPGVEVKGIVRFTDGTPAVSTEVALQVKGHFVGIGEGTCGTVYQRHQGLIVLTGRDGRFTLPMFEEAQSVIALNLAGYAQVSLAQLKQSPLITLQPWGQIEGTLRVGTHLATNVMVSAYAAPAWLDNDRAITEKGAANDASPNDRPARLSPLEYLHTSKTDSHGRFAFTYVPPGPLLLENGLSQEQSLSGNYSLAILDVKPGETTVTNVVSVGRTVTGHLQFPGNQMPEMSRSYLYLTTLTDKYVVKLQLMKSPDERDAFLESKEIQPFRQHFASYGPLLQTDGSFRAEGVQPGYYSMSMWVLALDPTKDPPVFFHSFQSLIVPPAKDDQDDSAVDLGVVEMKKLTESQAQNAATATSQSEVKGLVFGPDGQPATDAEVALQVEGQYWTLGKKKLEANSLQNKVMQMEAKLRARDKGASNSPPARQEWLQVKTGPDGRFTLPMAEGAQSVIALNEAGYAQVSLADLSQSPQIRLQPWGRIEGTLRVGHHLGTNDVVALTSGPEQWVSRQIHGPAGQTNYAGLTKLPEPLLNPDALKATTDDQGRFVIRFVPPGMRCINRLRPQEDGGWICNSLATVEVKPGATLVTTVGGAERTVRGTVKFADGRTIDQESRAAFIMTSDPVYLDKVRRLKTDAEREAYFNSEEAVRWRNKFHSYAAPLQPNGTFQADDVPSGEYQLSWDDYPAHFSRAGGVQQYYSNVKLVVPPARDAADESAVDWGVVELAKQDLAK